MGLEDFIPSEGTDNQQQSSEISEKIKEASKKASAGIKKIQKDEKRAKDYDILLSYFLVEIIKNKKYDPVLNDLFRLFDLGCSSNFLVGILSLIYQPISDKIRDLSKKEKIIFDYNKTIEVIEFDENNLDTIIKKRINHWIEDIIDILSIEYSSIQIQNIKGLYTEKEFYLELKKFMSVVFTYFFSEINIHISEKKVDDYSTFILKEIFLKINKINLEDI